MIRKMSIRLQPTESDPKNHDFGRWGSKREFDPPCAQFIKKKPGIEPPGANAPLPPKVERVGRAGVARSVAREMNLQGKQRSSLQMKKGCLSLELDEDGGGERHQRNKKGRLYLVVQE